MNNQTIDFPKRKEITEILRRNNVVMGAVFGSRANNKNHSDSDYDLLIEFDQNVQIPFSRFIKIHNKIKKTLGKDVDLVTSHGLGKKSFKKEVLATMRVFYDKRCGLGYNQKRFA